MNLFSIINQIDQHFVWLGGPFRIYRFTTNSHITSHMREGTILVDPIHQNESDFTILHRRDIFKSATVSFITVYETHCLSAHTHTQTKHSPWSSLCFMVQFNCNKVIKLLWGRKHEESKKKKNAWDSWRKEASKKVKHTNYVQRTGCAN